MENKSIMDNLKTNDAHKSLLTLPGALWRVAHRPYFAEGMKKLKANLPWGTRNKLEEVRNDDHVIFKNSGFEMGPLLGKGTFSRVVMAYWAPYRQNVAVKVYTKRHDHESRWIQHLLPIEVEMLKKLKHPHIVSFYGALEMEHRVYLIMELIGNGNLLEYLMKYDRVPEPQALIWFAQLVSAIKYTHDLEIVHRDIKLENILLDMRQNVRMTDFGFATPDITWSEDVPNADWSKIYDLRGSRGYMAPEMVFGEPYSPLLVDVWAMGIVLYCILFGKFPLGYITPESINRMVAHFHIPFDPKISVACEEVLRQIFQLEAKRIRSIDLLKCKWLSERSVEVELGTYTKYTMADAKIVEKREKIMSKPQKAWEGASVNNKPMHPKLLAAAAPSPKLALENTEEESIVSATSLMSVTRASAAPKESNASRPSVVFAEEEGEEPQVDTDAAAFAEELELENHQSEATDEESETEIYSSCKVTIYLTVEESNNTKLNVLILTNMLR